MEDRGYLFGLVNSPLSPRAVSGLLQSFKNAGEAWKAPLSFFAPGERDALLLFRKRFDLESEWERFKRSGVRTLAITDPEYPPGLKAISDPPPLLFYRGMIKPGPALSIVGARKASARGKLVARKLAEGLVECGFTVVSGLARGTDMAAHLGALDGNGTTWAVLGSGLGKLYPPENANLAKRIELEGGAVISEFPMEMEPWKGNFPRRNRIISALSLGTVVVEADKRSGALITAKFANDQGRLVFVVSPDIVNGPTEGNLSLLKDGATEVREIKDIIEDFPYLTLPVTEKRAGAPTTGIEETILSVLHPQKEMKSFEALMQKIKGSVGQVTAALTVLESRGLIARCPGNIYTRI